MKNVGLEKQYIAILEQIELEVTYVAILKEANLYIKREFIEDVSAGFTFNHDQLPININIYEKRNFYTPHISIISLYDTKLFRLLSCSMIKSKSIISIFNDFQYLRFLKITILIFKEKSFIKKSII